LNYIRGGVLGFRGSEFVEKLREEPVAYIIDRGSFDRFLTLRAVGRGAELWEGCSFEGFESSGGSFLVRTSKGSIRADFIVGADGFYSKTAKRLGLNEKRKMFRSVELIAEADLTDRVVIDTGLVKRGYAWIFPKGDGRVSVGVASTGRENLKGVLYDYMRNHGYLKPGRVVSSLKGWMIPFCEREEDLRLGRGRILLVGDSAGMVDPLLGEGIYYAVLGANLLADSILESPANPQPTYYRKVKGLILPELVYAGKIAKIGYRFQRIAFRMGRGVSLDRFMNLLLGDTNYRRLYRRGWVEFIKSAVGF
jgi:geranylgeranyl reductase family protein